MITAKLINSVDDVIDIIITEKIETVRERIKFCWIDHFEVGDMITITESTNEQR